ncbi:uncharacterized protein N7446_005543 [Penicillium canescens]|nr:uncharacterized protein N7446_005543 [Penicillium canescens]KAJ6061423.1 hypothetical protein N7446_005543 [Penicillium canescens]
MSMTKHSFKFMFNHVFLPPLLPEYDDEDEKDGEWPLERTLHRFALETLESFIQEGPQASNEAWTAAISMLKNWIELDKQGVVCKDTLASILSNIKTHGAAALYIRAQNCGLVAYYDKSGDKVIFDAFEVSPRAKDVISAPGSLVRQLPGQSVAISGSMLEDARFCTEISSIIARLSTESVAEMIPKSSKAGKPTLEERDTIHPGLVTEGLMSQLLAFGEHNEGLSFTKNTRDEVNWRKSKLPWRRSPHWFMLRVALQSVLQRALPDGQGYKEYKNFMLYLVAEFGNRSRLVRPAVAADQLEIIRAKICRRIFKLRGGVYDFVALHAKSAEAAIRATLQAVHQDIMSSNSMTIPEGFACTPQDVQMSLENSREYLQSAMNRISTAVEQSYFDREHEPRNQLNRHGLPLLKSGDLLSLADFEQWVANEMQNWYRGTESSENLCCLLAELLQNYSQFAAAAYNGSPETMSVAIVCMLELWVVVDKMCIDICPLMKSYSPELPSDFLEPLLLPQCCEMQRATGIEAYIQARHSACTAGTLNIFSDPGAQSFPVAYFNDSEKHRGLRESIQQHARAKLESKRNEWQNKTHHHEELLRQAAQMSHQWDVDSRGREYHSGTCQLCSIQNHASNLSIGVYEWPLPSNENTLKTVVFELDCPRWFASWRDVTWRLLHDFGRLQSKKGSNIEQNLLSYKDTQSFCVNWGQRLTLGSKTKSWKRTHYNNRHFPVDFGDITPPNAFQFRLMDSKENTWVVDQSEYTSVKARCTFALPPGPYSCLQYTVDSCGHSQNQIIADQQRCPSEMSLHEYIAFGCLRAGRRVQWHNMVRELASSTLSMNEEAVGMLFRQAAWEFGPASPASTLREAHLAFKHEALGDRLVECLNQNLSSIEANWNKYHALHTLVVLGLRTLSLSKDFSIVERAAAFLRRSRKIALRWCEDLVTTLGAQAGTHSQAQQFLIVMIGGVCQLTYAVEPQHLLLLLDTRTDLYHLMRSSILVFENSPPSHENAPVGIRNSLISTTKILHSLEEPTRQFIEKDAAGFNEAIRHSVHDVGITSTWTICSGNLSRWVTNKTNASHHGRQQDIHYNLLSGELLLANRPPGRLPKELANTYGAAVESKRLNIYVYPSI